MTNGEREELQRQWQNYMNAKMENAKKGLQQAQQRAQEAQQREQGMSPAMPAPMPKLPTTPAGKMPIPFPFPPSTAIKSIIPQQQRFTNIQIKGPVQVKK